MPTRNFFQRLADLVSQGGSQRSIIARFRGEGFRGANDRLRAFINRLRGRGLSGRQRGALGSVGINVTVGPLPRSIEITARIGANYRVVRDQLNRRGEVLLSGSVNEVQSFVIPLEASSQLIENQALARLEEEINRRVQSAGLAQAGNYLAPEITSQSVEILSSQFTDFV